MSNNSWGNNARSPSPEVIDEIWASETGSRDSSDPNSSSTPKRYSASSLESAGSGLTEELERQENGSLQEKINLVGAKCLLLKKCLISAEAVVMEFEKRSGEKQTAEAAMEMLQEAQARVNDIGKEADKVLENGYLDGFTSEELQEAVEQVRRKIAKETKLVYLVLALAWDRFPSTIDM